MECERRVDRFCCRDQAEKRRGGKSDGQPPFPKGHRLTREGLSHDPVLCAEDVPKQPRIDKLGKWDFRTRAALSQVNAATAQVVRDCPI
jgi:hypothetical protein